MAEYLELFQDITSTDLSISSKSSSQEIQGFAIRLQQTIQPCFSELNRSAASLKELLQPCFNELIHAEAEWQSKLNVIQASATDIREQVGHFIGYLSKIRLFKAQLVSQVLEQAQSSWQQRVDKLKAQWFTDSKNNSLKSVSPLDKQKFIQAVRFEFYPQAIEINSALAQALKPTQVQLQQMQLTKVVDHLNLLTDREKPSFIFLVKNLDLSILQSRLQEPVLHFSTETQNFFDRVNPLFNRLIDQGFSAGNLPEKSAIKSLMRHGIIPLTWENFFGLAEDVRLEIERLINTVIENAICFVTTLLEQSVQFYDHFLEKQQRYQQETIEQRKFEHNWLLGKRQGLEKIRNDLDFVLSSLSKT